MGKESLADFRGSASLFFDLFRHSPVVFALERLNLTSPFDRETLADVLEASRSGDAVADRDAAAIADPGPVDALRPRPLDDVVQLSALGPGTAIALLEGPPVSPFDQGPPGFNTLPRDGRFQVQFLTGFDDPLVVDTLAMEILSPAQVSNTPLGEGSTDTLLLAGPFDDATTLPVGLTGLETIVLQGGSSYDLSALDSHVDAGARVTVDARNLGSDDSVIFDAGDEDDGAFLFFGGGGDDEFLGGAGEDRIVGGAGADRLRGGAGADTFGYGSAVESSGADYDTLLGFNAAEDRIDLPGAVTGFAAAVTSGSLSAASFDTDLAAALAGLGAGRAGLFAPTAGDLAGTVFLVVDGNGEAGYQAGEDFVFALPGVGIADLGSSTAIFV